MLRRQALDEIASLTRTLEGYRSDVRIDWRDFESYCSRVVAENGYQVKRNVWLGGKRRRQIDVIGSLFRRVLSIDCKAWTRAGGPSRLVLAASKQRERTALLKDRCSRGLNDLDPSVPFYPLIVTLRDEVIRVVSGTPIVSFIDFNSFLVHMDSYGDLLVPV